MSDFELYGFENAKRVGQGSYASVYSAIHPLTKKEVALKVCKKNSKTTFKEIAFLKELKGCCDHIISIRQIYYFFDKLAIELEFFPYDLYTFIRKVKHKGFLIDKSTRKQLIRQLLEAVFACHIRSIVHADIKPNNILLRNDGDMVLSDFGLAKKLQNLIVGTTGNLLQTPFYRAPEMFSKGGVI